MWKLLKVLCKKIAYMDKGSGNKHTSAEMLAEEKNF